jgi:hypothetical protein
MSGEAPHESGEPERPLQFSLKVLLGVVTGFCAVLGLAMWIGPAVVGSGLMIGGFGLVLLGDSLRRHAPVVCGGLAMMAGSAVLVVLGVARIVFP